jgi:hypothetical protein
MREPNRKNSQEWAIEFARQAALEDSEVSTEAEKAEEVLAAAIRLIESGVVDPEDPQLTRLRRLLAAS